MSIFHSFPFRPTRVSAAVSQELVPENAGIHTFQFDSMPIRVLTDEESTPWFVAKDAATALGYENTTQAVRAHCKKAINLQDLKGAVGQRLKENQSLKLHPLTALIPESDLYRLTMKSTLESAGRFQDWVTEEVLPQIRKTGAYVPQHISQLPSLTQVVHQITGVMVKLEERILVTETRQVELDARIAATEAEQQELDARLAKTEAQQEAIVKGVDAFVLALQGEAPKSKRTRRSRSADPDPRLETYLYPTGLAQRFWLDNSRHVNKLLEAAGLQVRGIYECKSGTRPNWIPTEIGAPHCIVINAFRGIIRWDPDFIAEYLNISVM